MSRLSLSLGRLLVKLLLVSNPLLHATVGEAAPPGIKITPKNEMSFVSIDRRFRGAEVRCRMRNGVARVGTVSRKRGATLWRAIGITAKTKAKVRELKAACEQQPAPPGAGNCSPPPGFLAVADASELFSLSDPTKNYFLCRNIRLLVPQRPLFPNAQFTGVFDFNNKTIDGLKIDAPDELIVGLIRINNGVLKNLKLVNSEVSGAALVGVMAGINNGTIENVTIEDAQVKARFMGGGGAVGLSMRPPEPSLAVRRARGANGDVLGAIGIQRR